MNKDLSKQNDSLVARLSGYAATAGAMMALAPSVNGQVVHSGLQNIQLDMPFDTVRIDMNDDAIPDFNFLIYGYSSYSTNGQYYYVSAFGTAVIMNPKTDSYKNSWITRMTSTVSTSFTNSQTYYNYKPVPIVDGLDPGLVVDGSASLWSNISYPRFPGALGIGTIYYSNGPDGIYSYANGYGDFLNESRFIGVRFYIGTDHHYGWIRVRLGEFIDPLTIIDWAYESTPGLGIVTGDGGNLAAPVATLDAGLVTTEDILVTVTVSFDKAISGLEIDDFEISNGSAGNLTEVTTGTEFTIDVSAASTGTVVVTLPEGSVVDESGNENNETSTSWEFTSTVPGPIATLDAGVTETYDKTIAVEVNFDKEIVGLSIDDFEINNGSAAILNEVTAGREYTIEVTAMNAGTVNLSLPAGSVEDGAGNENEIAHIAWQYIVINDVEFPNSLSYKLFPNPADNLLRIELENIADITLINTSGKVVLQNIDVLNESFDVSHLSPGIYILQISSDKQTIREKVLIN